MMNNMMTFTICDPFLPLLWQPKYIRVSLLPCKKQKTRFVPNVLIVCFQQLPDSINKSFEVRYIKTQVFQNFPISFLLLSYSYSHENNTHPHTNRHTVYTNRRTDTRMSIIFPSTVISYYIRFP